MPDDFLTVPTEIVAAIQSCINSRKASSLAVAFWGQGAAQRLGLANAAHGTRILLNAPSGACNPSELQLLTQKFPNLEVRSHKRLHAKVAIGPQRMLVGSANASANGLGFDGNPLSGWHEACTVVESATAIVQAISWFNNLWSDAVDVTPALIKQAERAHNRLKRHAQAIGEGGEIIEGSQIYVVTSDEDSNINEAEAKRKVKDSGGDEKNVDFFQDWSSIPSESFLISYAVDCKTRRSDFDGLWVTRRGFESITLKDGKKANPVFRANDSDRAEFGLPPRTGKGKSSMRWAKTVDALIRKLGDSKALADFKKRPGVQYNADTDWCISLYEFLAFCRRHQLPIPAPWDATTESNGRA